MEPDFEEINKCIVTGDLDKAVKLLNEHTFSSNYKVRLDQIKARLVNYDKDLINGTQSSETLEVTKNRIVLSILKFAADLQTQDETNNIDFRIDEFSLDTNNCNYLKFKYDRHKEPYKPKVGATRSISGESISFTIEGHTIGYYPDFEYYLIDSIDILTKNHIFFNLCFIEEAIQTTPIIYDNSYRGFHKIKWKRSGIQEHIEGILLDWLISSKDESRVPKHETVSFPIFKFILKNLANEYLKIDRIMLDIKYSHEMWPRGGGKKPPKTKESTYEIEILAKEGIFINDLKEKEIIIPPSSYNSFSIKLTPQIFNDHLLGHMIYCRFQFSSNKIIKSTEYFAVYFKA